MPEHEETNVLRPRHRGSCRADRTAAGWVLQSATSADTPEEHCYDFFVPFAALRPDPPSSIGIRLARALRHTLLALEGARTISRSEESRLFQGVKEWAHRGPVRRVRLQSLCKDGEPGLRRWKRSHDGVCYSAERSHRGWVVSLCSIWGNSYGVFLVPFHAVQQGSRRWDAGLLPTALRGFVAGLEGARETDQDESIRLLGFDKRTGTHGAKIIKQHLGICFAHRTETGWVVDVGGSGGRLAARDFFVPFKALRPSPPLSLDLRLAKTCQDALIALEGTRRIDATEATRLFRGMKEMTTWGPVRRRKTQTRCKELGLPWGRRHSVLGLVYTAGRSRRGWVVTLSSAWGSPRGTYLVPFRALGRRGRRWDDDLLPEAMCRLLAGLEGARKLDWPSEVERLLGWDKYARFFNPPRVSQAA